METSFHSISFFLFAVKYERANSLRRNENKSTKWNVKKKNIAENAVRISLKRTHRECERCSSFQFGVVFAFEQSSTVVVVVSAVHVSLACPILRFELEMVGAVPFRWILLVFPIYVRCAMCGIENTCQLLVLGFFCVYFWFWAVGTFSKYFLQLSTYPLNSYMSSDRPLKRD